MAEFLVESAEEAKNWVEGLGIKLTGVEKKDGSSLARSYTLADGGSLSEALSEALVKKVEDLKIPVKTGAEVKEIVMNADGVVTGVKAEIDGTRRDHRQHCRCSCRQESASGFIRNGDSAH